MARKRIGVIPKDYDQATMRTLFDDVETRLGRLENPLREVYTVTNGSTSRSLDVSAATLAQVRAFLGTLITDLQAAGKLGK